MNLLLISANFPLSIDSLKLVSTIRLESEQSYFDFSKSESMKVKDC